MRLKREFYTRTTLEVAPDLLGKFLVFHSPQGKLIGEINEVEAYLGELDPASHAYRGVTSRTEVMFGIGGFVYVYFIYGMYFCMNVVTDQDQTAGAVLIRSVIPREGIDIMVANRGATTPEKLTNGPGKFAKAFGITREHYGIDLVTSEVMYIEDRGKIVKEYASTPRVGISKAQEKLYRFHY